MLLPWPIEKDEDVTTDRFFASLRMTTGNALYDNLSYGEMPDQVGHDAGNNLFRGYGCGLVFLLYLHCGRRIGR